MWIASLTNEPTRCNVARNIGALLQDLLLKVTLPGVTSAASINLDLGEKEVVLSVEGRYRLCAPLPYKVNETKVSTCRPPPSGRLQGRL